jgi:hypothetical protein
VRIFLSFNSKDTAFANAIRAGLSKREPTAQIFFSRGGASGKTTRTIGWKHSCATLACVRDFGVLSR